MLRIISSLALAALVLTAAPLGLRANDGGDDGDATAAGNCGGCVATGGGAVGWLGAGAGAQQQSVTVTVQFQSGKCLFVQAANECLEKKCQMTGAVTYNNLPNGSTLTVNGVAIPLNLVWGHGVALPGLEVPCDRSEPYVVSWNGNASTFDLACSKCKKGN